MLTCLHRFPVIAMLPTGQSRDGKPGFMIVVDRGDATRERYVSSLWFEGDKEWCNGFYTHRLDEAIHDMRSRAASKSTEVRNGIRGAEVD